MRGALCPPPRLPGLRILSGPPDHHGHGGGLISFERIWGGEPLRSLHFLYANCRRCHGWRSRVRGGHRRHQAGPGGPSPDHRTVPGGTAGPNRAGPPAEPAARFAPAHRGRQRGLDHGRQTAGGDPAQKRFLDRPRDGTAQGRQGRSADFPRQYRRPGGLGHAGLAPARRGSSARRSRRLCPPNKTNLC